MKNLWTQGLIFSICVSGCLGKRTEPQAPSEVRSPLDKDAGDAQAGSDNIMGGQVFQMGAASIKGIILNEKSLDSSSEIRLGLEIYFNDQRIRAHPELYTVSLTVAQTGANDGVSVSQTRASQGTFDFVITVDGPDVSRIRNSFDSIRLFLTVVSRSARSSSSISPNLSQVILAPE